MWERLARDADNAIFVDPRKYNREQAPHKLSAR